MSPTTGTAGAPDTPSAPRRGRPPKGASQLSRDSIVEATFKVIDTEGVAGVSMRSVARVLGVDAKSLYNHIDGKGGLLDAVAEEFLGGLKMPDATGDVRRDLEAIANAFRDRALLHPEAAALVLTRQLSSLEGLAPVESVLVVLRRAGWPTDEAVHLLRALVGAIIGALLREVSAGPTFGITDTQGIAERQATLEASGLSAVSEAAHHLARFDANSEYAFTVNLTIDAVLSRLPPSRPGQRG